ncbi:MAG TPA: 16S rRNA (guanine(527)-N(7))-methyltransferase RsmG [Kofleriaceae bacterium]
MTQLVMSVSTLGIPESSQEKLIDFKSLFMKWNRSINLSGARTEDQVELHIVDCLHAIPHLRTLVAASREASSAESPSALDVGAGGGMPSVVAAICLPDLQVTALEPVHKKCSFLRVAARELALSNFVALAERLEQHQRRDYGAAMSRATFDLREWLQLGQSYVRPGGLVLGFEAVPRTDLPAGTQRHSYSLEGKARAIVVAERPPAGTAAQ